MQTFWKIAAALAIAYSFGTALYFLISTCSPWFRLMMAMTLGVHFVMAVEYVKCSHSSAD